MYIPSDPSQRAAEIIRLFKECEAAQNTIASLQGNLDRQTRHFEKLRTQCSAFQISAEDACNRAAKAVEERNQVQADLAVAVADRARALADKATAIRDLGTRTTELAQERARVSSLTRALESKESELSQAKAKFGTDPAEVTRLSNEVRNLTGQVTTLTGQLQTANADKATLKSERDGALQREREALQRESAAQQAAANQPQPAAAQSPTSSTEPNPRTASRRSLKGPAIAVATAAVIAFAFGGWIFYQSTPADVSSLQASLKQCQQAEVTQVATKDKAQPSLAELLKGAPPPLPLTPVK
jgi:chromosome segregation ATPase